jgi:hypothetical protein
VQQQDRLAHRDRQASARDRQQPPIDRREHRDEQPAAETRPRECLHGLVDPRLLALWAVAGDPRTLPAGVAVRSRPQPLAHLQRRDLVAGRLVQALGRRVATEHVQTQRFGAAALDGVLGCRQQRASISSAPLARPA